MIKYEEACKIAYEKFKENWGIIGIGSAKDLGEKWFFLPSYTEDDCYSNAINIIISKENGQINYMPIPDINIFESLENATNLEIPENFKVKKEDLIDLYTKKFGGYPTFLLMGASDEQIIEKLLKSLKTGKELIAENQDADY